MDLATGFSVVRFTDQSGRFLVDPAPGQVNLLEVSALGFQTHVDTVYFPDLRDPLSVEVWLGVDVIPMEPLVVVGARRPVWESTQPSYLWEYFERQEFFGKAALGRFYDREKLQMRFGETGSLTLLETLWPALYRVDPYGFDPDACGKVLYFVDGLPFRGGNLREMPWGVEDLVGVELYSDKYGIPAEFQTAEFLRPESEPPCAVLALWTERPVVPGGLDQEEPGSGFFRPLMMIFAVVLTLALL
jgi:hypothetical protein